MTHRTITRRTPLTGCRFCGIEPGRHAEQPHPVAGWHHHVTPTREQLTARLRDHQVDVLPLDRAVRTRAVAELLAHAATGHQAVALARAALSAGFLWRCVTCGADHFPDVVTCGCGTVRPTRVR